MNLPNLLSVFSVKMETLDFCGFWGKSCIRSVNDAYYVRGIAVPEVHPERENGVWSM